MNEDPIVAEVRAARDAIARECGYDLKKLAEREKSLFRQWQGKKMTYEQWQAEQEARAAARVAEDTKPYGSGPA